MYKIPLFDLNFGMEEEEAALKTIQSGWISTGPNCAEFETVFSEMLGTKHAVSLSNCTVALHLALVLLDIKDGDEVLCPSLTFAATVNSIKYVNATPVFCDIESVKRPVIDPKEIEKNITSKTKAIIVMHYAGFACDMIAIMDLAKRHNLKVIEDACHAPLSEYRGEKLGTIGDIGCFSFFSNKNISTGEGGMMIMNDASLYKRARLLRSHGMTTMSYERSKGHATKYDVTEVGYNYRMDDIRASIGVVQLKKLENDLQQRRIIRKNYINLISKIKGVTIPFEEETEFSSNYIFPIVIDDVSEEKRDEIRETIHSLGVQTSMHYPPVHNFSCYFNENVSLPKTMKYTDQTITLPMYSKLGSEDIDFIVDVLTNALN